MSYKISLLILAIGAAAGNAQAPSAQPAAPTADQGKRSLADEVKANEEKIQVLLGVPVKKGEFPFHVEVMNTGAVTATNILQCGGTLISRHWVLTAAHCFNMLPEKQTGVLVGQNDLATSADTSIKVKIVRPPAPNQYVASNLANDVVLLKLDTPVEQIDPVRLASPAAEDLLLGTSYDSAPPSWGAKATIFGWGMFREALSNVPASLSNALRKGRVTVVPLSTCQNNESLRGFSVYRKICAGAPKANACPWDSGGPLLIRDKDDKSVQLGIISAGDPDKCTSLVPTLFTRVAKYYCWIASVDHEIPSPPECKPDRN